MKINRLANLSFFYMSLVWHTYDKTNYPIAQMVE